MLITVVNHLATLIIAVGQTGTWGVIAANDCELFSNSIDGSRTCNENTQGQITARLCSDEPLCHVGCGDIDECDATGNGLNDCATIAAAGNYANSFTCTNTIGSYTCDRGAETLQPNLSLIHI